MLVLYVHDVSDVAVDVTKMANYLKLEGRRGWFASEISFVSLLVTWVYYRLFEFPFRAIKASFSGPISRLGLHPRTSYSLLFFHWISWEAPLYTWLNSLLFVLLALHLYWFLLLVLIAWRILTESVRDASRKDYEGDSD